MNNANIEKRKTSIHWMNLKHCTGGSWDEVKGSRRCVALICRGKKNL